MAKRRMWLYPFVFFGLPIIGFVLGVILPIAGYIVVTVVSVALALYLRYSYRFRATPDLLVVLFLIPITAMWISALIAYAVWR